MLQLVDCEVSIDDSTLIPRYRIDSELTGSVYVHSEKLLNKLRKKLLNSSSSTTGEKIR